MARVLIVDDSAEYTGLFQSGLEALGREVTTAANRLEALDALAMKRFDVIFLDVVMRGGGAITLVHEVREIDRTTPIVVISGVPEVLLSPVFTAGMAQAQAKLRKSATLTEINQLISRLTEI